MASALSRRIAVVLTVLSTSLLGVQAPSAQAATPQPRTFAGDLLGVPGGPHTFIELCDYFTPPAPADFPPFPTVAQMAAFQAAEDLTVHFDRSDLLRITPLHGPGPLQPLGELVAEVIDATIDGVDAIITGSGDQMIFSYEVADVIVAGTGDDFICAGPGRDVIIAGGGDDQIIGGAGRDTIIGGSGDDISDTDQFDTLCLLGSGDNVGC